MKGRGGEIVQKSHSKSNRKWRKSDAQSREKIEEHERCWSWTMVARRRWFRCWVVVMWE
ncbi:hypothetical protein L195_g024454 [Trifolium pratense]|uniref:Uncharacterized protein n=1 Tax=Trifolium pratense TaxID=57577 RepID=A0A2K3NDR4_TRIPR|nr:hypothetical protein L195_g024454 [Trifolium pratense]